MCDICKGTAKCHLCDGAGFVNHADVQGHVTMFNEMPCAGCFGSGLCVACQGHTPADNAANADEAA